RGRRGPVHRRLSGLRRVRPDRARPELERAYLERLVRRLRGDAEPARESRQGHRARLHSRIDQLPGGPELRRREPAGGRRGPHADGQAQSASATGPARPPARLGAAQLPQPGGLRQRPGDRRGAAPERREPDPRRPPTGAGVDEKLRSRHRRPAQLRAGAPPGAGQRVLHERGERTMGPRLGLGGRGESMKRQRPLRLGLLSKLILFLALTLVPLAAITWWISVRAITANLTDEFTSKGTAIARSLASSAVDLLLTRDASTVQGLVDQVGAINGVKYVMVYDQQKTLVAHTFAPLVPPGIVDRNLVPGDAAQQVRQIAYPAPVTGAPQQIIDIGVPVLAGQLGTVRVGMDRSIITAAAVRSGQYLLLVFLGVAMLAVLAGVLFAHHITKPVTEVVRAAERVGQGDLTRLVTVSSRDEIGQLATTFNDTIVRLRSQVQTESERDEERHKREDLQRNIMRFLETATEIARGDLTRRGQVTSDVLGSVVDAINVMVEELATLIEDVREAAQQVLTSSTEMMGTMEATAGGAQTQSREAVAVNDTMEALTRS